MSDEFSVPATSDLVRESREGDVVTLEFNDPDHLNAMNSMGPQPWQVSFSYGRALQAPVLAAWRGQESNAEAAQKALLKRCHLNGLARDGQYSRVKEDAA